MKAIGLKIKFCLLALLLKLSSAEVIRGKTSLNDYPVREEIVVSLDECIVMPRGFKNYRTTTKTKIKVLKKHLSTLTPGEVWAVIDQDRMDHELRVLNFERKVYTNSVEKLRRAQDLKKEDVLEKVALIEEEKFRLEELAGESELSEQLGTLITERLEVLESQISESMKEIDDNKLQADYMLELEALDLGIDSKEKVYKDLTERSQIKAPFSGVLELNLGGQEPVPHEYEVEANTLYGTLTDDSRYELQMKNQNSALKSSESNLYSVILRLGGQKGEIRAAFEGFRREELNGRLKKIAIFEVDHDSIELAKDVVEEIFSVFVMKKLPESCHIVRKNDIALLNPEILQSKGWPGLVSELWPSSKLVEVGLYDLAIISKGE